MMKKLTPFLFLILLAFCGESRSSEKSESGNILENLTYSIDTVVVDPGEEIINLSTGLRLSDVSQDRSQMYIYSEEEAKLSVIDLDLLQLKGKIPFEKEGPNGVGNYLWQISAISEGSLLIGTFQDAAIFDFKGQKLQDIRLDKEDVKGIAESKELQNNNLRVSHDLERYYTLPGSVFSMENKMELAVIDRKSLDGKLMTLPALEINLDFMLTLTSKEITNVQAEDIFLLDQNGRFYISSSATSDLYEYDPKADSLQLYSFPIQSIPRSKTDFPGQRKLTDVDVWNAEIEKINTQIRYGPLLWDDSRQYFFRIASIRKSNADPEIKAKNDVFLLAFDKDMNLLGETQLEELIVTPSYPFFKDGKLWSYVNVEDELGFAVFTFNF